MSPAFLQSWSWKDPCGDAGIYLSNGAGRESSSLGWEREESGFYFSCAVVSAGLRFHRKKKKGWRRRKEKQNNA